MEAAPGPNFNTSLVVGWIGLGSMGGAMSKNIQKFFCAENCAALRVFNRTVAKCAPVKELGAIVCDSMTQLAVESDVIFISSSNDSAVIEIVGQIISSGDIKGKTVVDTTTVHPDTTRFVASLLAKEGALFAAMPVFGASPVAEAGQLLAAFAGPDAAYENIAPLLKGVVAREVLRVGIEPEKGSLLKTTGNLLMASLMQIIAEAHVFAEKNELPQAILERLLELNFGTVAHSDSVRMTTGVYCPGEGQAPWSDLDLALKDVGHGIKCAEQKSVSLKVGRTAFENLETAKKWADRNPRNEGGGRKLDSSSLYGVVRAESGLDFETDFVKARDSSSA